MSKTERKETLPSDEELFARNFFSEYLRDWKPGKTFYVSDDKANLIFENEKNVSPLKQGIQLVYKNLEIRPTAGDKNVALIVFVDKETSNPFRYNTHKSPDAVVNELTGLDIPTLIDEDLVEIISKNLTGKQYWIRTQIWNDNNDNLIRKKKYVPVLITKVETGNMFFPLKITFKDMEGDTGSVYMNVPTTNGVGAESRTFPILFSLSDPRLKYTTISDDNWKLIQSGLVTFGMTKDECRLALGSPSDVDSGHDWNNTIDIWRYADGTFLQFQDGLLIKFRQ